MKTLREILNFKKIENCSMLCDINKKTINYVFNYTSQLKPP